MNAWEEKNYIQKKKKSQQDLFVVLDGKLRTPSQKTNCVMTEPSQLWSWPGLWWGEEHKHGLEKLWHFFPREDNWAQSDSRLYFTRLSKIPQSQSWHFLLVTQMAFPNGQKSANDLVPSSFLLFYFVLIHGFVIQPRLASNLQQYSCSWHSTSKLEDFRHVPSTSIQTQ